MELANDNIYDNIFVIYQWEYNYFIKVGSATNHEGPCLSFIDNSNNYIIALEIAYYCY